VLANPTRRAILARLATGEASVMELAEPFAISQPAISKHRKMLERYREIWATNFERLDALLAELRAKPAAGSKSRRAKKRKE
jgi:DNA-binding transcriptional ArsR family regulator